MYVLTRKLKLSSRSTGPLGASTNIISGSAVIAGGVSILIGINNPDVLMIAGAARVINPPNIARCFNISGFPRQTEEGQE
jgi:hypothetical protein